MAREARALVDLWRMGPALLRQSRIASGVAASAGAGPVMVLPGFGAGPRSTWPLRHYLRQQGLAVEDWGLGTNLAGLDLPHALADVSAGWDLPDKQPYQGEGSLPYLIDRVTDHVVARAAVLGRPLTLVGWSLGGTIAREVARDRPDAVARVVTMGSPVIGGPKYTAAARALRARGLDIDWIEAQALRRDRVPITVPIIAFYSRRDGVVDWTAAIDRVSPHVRHVEIGTAHLGMGFAPELWRQVADAITLPAT